MFVSLPVRGAWIEIRPKKKRTDIWRSLPVRGAWIEIFVLEKIHIEREVAPREGSVD